MRKVSRLMLATIAAIQGGAHSRRKVMYLKEQVLVSHLYPLLSQHELKPNSSSHLSGRFLGSISLASQNVEFSTSVSTLVRSVLFELHAEGDLATYSANSEISITQQGIQQVYVGKADSDPDIINMTASSSITMSHYQVVFNTVNAGTESVVYMAQSNITITVNQ